MDKDTVVSLDLQDRDRALDWLTALSPIWLMGIIYFRWWALFLPVVTAAGYLAASWLLGRLRVLEIRVPAACCTGLLIALCLPSTTPVWVGALAGMAAAGVTALPTLLRRRWADAPALLHPALVGYLMVRLIFPAETTAFTMPAMWATDAVSSAQAKGLMQLSDTTFEWIANENDDIFDPKTNIKYGTFYFSKLYATYGDTDTALAAYNAGIGNVDKWLIDSRYSKDGKSIDSTPYGETNRYMRKINFYEKIYDLIYEF